MISPRALYQLSERECEVVQLLTTGASIGEVAQQMTITEHTVKWYIKDIYSKLGIHSRTQLILWAKELERASALEKGQVRV